MGAEADLDRTDATVAAMTTTMANHPLSTPDMLVVASAALAAALLTVTSPRERLEALAAVCNLSWLAVAAEDGGWSDPPPDIAQPGQVPPSLAADEGTPC